MPNRIVFAPELTRRFHSKVAPTDAGCWEWTASVLTNGYGQFHAQPHTTLAHRFSYMLHHGPIPEGMVIDHLCRNRKCVNPDHLEAVTQSVNLARGETSNAAFAARSVCDRGHPYTQENTGTLPQGGRRCRACSRESTARYRARRAAVA